MLIKSFPAGPWATNCYLVANEANSECIIIDPGFESLSGIKRIAEQFGLHPVATLLTHGHMDHVWSVVPLCKEHNIAAYLHSDDEWMVNEPEKAYLVLSITFILIGFSLISNFFYGNKSYLMFVVTFLFIKVIISFGNSSFEYFGEICKGIY